MGFLQTLSYGIRGGSLAVDERPVKCRPFYLGGAALLQKKRFFTSLRFVQNDDFSRRQISIKKLQTVCRGLRFRYNRSNMKIRDAKIPDAKAIYSLINFYAEQDKMLFRSLADIYENLRSFTVAELNGRVVGCCALQIIWSDLAEIKSLAVDDANTGKGIGSKLVAAALKRSRQLGVSRVFALTLNADFFKKLRFKTVKTNALPMKVWSDCAKCPKQQNCDETAVIRNLGRSKK